jgi:putative glutamine amidotransferase
MKLLITCRDKESVYRAYIPAVRLGGWEGPTEVLAPGDPLDSWEGILGVLLTGGDDIHPKHWDPNEPLHPTALVDEERDALEIPIATRGWEQGLPIFGICRGHQVLNVALGGSIAQDVPSECACPLDAHRRGDSLAPCLAHGVKIDPNSRIAGLLPKESFEVNSRHHQAVRALAPALRAVGWHEGTLLDGQPLIEAVEAIDASRWVFGVQWHPENLLGLEGDAGRAARGLFRAFAAELTTRMR